ncbi:hypothetical protein B0H14DRAFT_2741014 [Mycena olivaceomarginata]|nr:hypothetical protein B0H14DRAFT_2741014 [Mycena olivaceomarginata]
MAALVVKTLLYGIFLVLFFAMCYLHLTMQSRFSGAVLWRMSIEVSLLTILAVATAVGALSCVSSDNSRLYLPTWFSTGLLQNSASFPYFLRTAMMDKVQYSSHS